MCPPGCLRNICEQATRRGLLKASFGVGLAAASASFLTAAPAAAAAQTRSFTDVVDLTHPL
jgi:hypothetical protein